MIRSFYINNAKGGVCKSQIAIETATTLASAPYNFSVLYFSLDPQCDADRAMNLYGNRVKDIPTAYDVFTANATLNDAIVASDYGFDVLLSDSRFNKADVTFSSDVDNYYIISDIVKLLDGIYDIIIFDSSRTMDYINYAILYACDYVIVPTGIDDSGVNAIPNIYATIQKLKARGLSKAELLGLVVGCYDKNTTESEEVDQLLACIAEEYNCVKFSPIRKSIAVVRARKKHKPVGIYKKYDNASVDYRRFTKQVMDRVNELEAMKHE